MGSGTAFDLSVIEALLADRAGAFVQRLDRLDAYRNELLAIGPASGSDLTIDSDRGFPRLSGYASLRDAHRNRFHR